MEGAIVLELGLSIDFEELHDDVAETRLYMVGYITKPNMAEMEQTIPYIAPF